MADRRCSLRVLVLFVYRYLLRGGFLDGREGLIFFVLQACIAYGRRETIREDREKHREGFDRAGITMDGSEEKAVNRSQRTPAADEVIVEK